MDKWRVIRNASVEALEFPFSPYRGGQRELAVAVYRALSNGKTLFAQAPTGIGKTVSVLFPAIKRLPSGDAEKIFYLTAKTIGRNVAENTISQLCNRGLRLRALTLTARDKICFAPPGGSCDMKTCAYAVGYYDRRKEALKELCALERLTREQVERVARKHQVCPFALSQDAAEWVDLIICDFNYAFDPSAMLRDFFGEDGTANFLLIDEAHNLPDRAREMFSAELASSQFASAISDPGTGHGCKASLKKCLKAFQNLTNVLEFEAEAIASNAPPDKLAVTLRAFLEKAEQNLAEETSASSLETLRETYFAVLRFVRVLDNFDLSYQTIYRNESEHIRIKLFCIDPARSLLPILRESKGTVFFSATLAPLDYYRRLLAGQLPSEVLELASPFPSENLPVFVESRVATNFKERARTYATVAESIVQLVRAKRGNYLAFFPSYKYLEAVLAVVQLAAPDLAVVVQRSSMNESDRAQFMAHFDCENIQTLIGFAVMGGVFSEGIDLVGDRLVGAIVVGVGLPQISLERNLITNYFAALGQNGFNYGYVFPGMNRVLQAVGRVIRSETDRGVALLIDERFARWPYRELLPRWWDLKPMQRDTPLSELVSRYWETPLS